MGKLLNKIAKGKIVASDGAWGTQLQEKGLKAGECPEIWNIERRKDVLDIARSYVEAGADMVETNSFGGNQFTLANFGLEDRVYEINRAAAEISREACGDTKIVLGSMGPTGKILMMGDITPEEMYDAFKQQAIALEEGGADALIIETMTDLEEARIATKAARENTGLDIVSSMTFDNTPAGGIRTVMGISPADMVDVLKEAGASILGSNCGNGTKEMIPVLKEIRKADPDIAVLIQGNAGMPQYNNGKIEYNESPDITAGFVKELVLEGANIIGGCCGTTPEHIRRIVKELHSIRK